MSFWRGRRVFLTGHTGFKGAWLALTLADQGAEVTGYALPPPTDPSLFELAGVAEMVHHVEGDVRDGANLARSLRDARPEVVFHLAAQALVRPSYEDPVTTYATNVMGTVHLLEAVRATSGARAVVCVTSDKCYDNADNGRPHLETDAMGGRDPYSSSKGCAELVVAAYRSSYLHPADFADHGVAIATARAGNVIGGGDWGRDRLVPDLLRAYVAGLKPALRSPDAIRPWQHVIDPLNGYMRLAERLHGGDLAMATGWNFGPDIKEAKPVRWVADTVARMWGDGASWELSVEPQPREVSLLNLDCSKAREHLGWRQILDLEQALARTVEWTKAWIGGSDMRETTLAQIRRYGDVEAERAS